MSQSLRGPIASRMNVLTRPCCTACVVLLLATMLACSGNDRPPNVVLVIVDDLGWRDLGVYGSTFYDTPAIDSLARAGALFTQFYAASPVCSPTRASLMTGRHPARLGITNWIGGERDGPLLQAEYERQLALEEYTLGEAFRDAGFATGYIGKWHLGIAPYLPDSQGFDVTVAVNDGGQPSSYFYPYRDARTPRLDVPDLEDGTPDEYLTDRLTAEAVRFIESHDNEPFFLVLSHYAVHTPLQAPDELVRPYAERSQALRASDPGSVPEGPNAFTKLRQDHPVYAAMVERVDHSLGRLVETLDALGLADRTIVVLVSDNGGLSTMEGRETGMPTSNEPLRAGKGWLYEGGIRIPLIVRAPAVEAGTVVTRPGVTMDLFPTLLDLVGLAPLPAHHLDGSSLVPLLVGADRKTAPLLSWHFPHYHGSGNVPSGAIRAGDWKMIEWFETGAVELYDLATDSAEVVDVAAVQEAVADSLRALLTDWRAAVAAAMPVTNPAWER
jgi:arylsulfatase A-like enzyme